MKFWVLLSHFILFISALQGLSSHASDSISDLDDVLDALVSPEPKFRGVSEVISGDRMYFGALLALAKKRSKTPYGEYSALDAWAKEKLTEYLPLVEQGEAYKEEFYRQKLEIPKSDPKVREVSKHYLDVLAFLKGDAPSKGEPPLFTHPNAQRATEARLSQSVFALDANKYPDAYKRELNRGTFRLLQQPDYSQKEKLKFQGDLQKAKELLEKMQIGAFKEFLKGKEKKLFVAPVENFNDPYGTERSEIKKFDINDLNSLDIKVKLNRFGSSVFYFEKPAPDGSLRKFVFGHSEKKGYWHPYSYQSGHSTLLGEEEFLGVLESDFLKDKVSNNDLSQAVLKKYINLSSALRKDLEKVQKPKDLPSVASSAIRKLSDFNQHPSRSAFFWDNCYGLSEYRGETNFYNRLIDGIIWAGRAQDTLHGTNYWERRDLEADLAGRPFFSEALSNVPLSRAQTIKSVGIKSLNWIGDFFSKIKNQLIKDDLSSVFHSQPLSNTSEAQVQKLKSNILYRIQRASKEANATQFKIPENDFLSDKKGSIIEEIGALPGKGIILENKMRQVPDHGRLYLTTPRAHTATRARIVDDQGKEWPPELWSLKVDPSSGHHWIDFKNLESPKLGFFTKVEFSPNAQASPRADAMEQLLVKDLSRLTQLNAELEAAGFSAISTAIDNLISQATLLKTPLSVDEIGLAFQMNSQYSFEKEKGRWGASAKKTKDFEIKDFKRFQNKEGIVCAQCDAGNEFFAAFMTRYFENNPRVSVNSESVFQVPSKAAVLSGGDGHKVVMFQVDNVDTRLVDATPDLKTLERMRKQQEALEKAKMEMEDSSQEEHKNKKSEESAEKSVLVRKKENRDIQVEMLKGYFRRLIESQEALVKTLSNEKGQVMPSLRKGVSVNDPLGRSMRTARGLTHFLNQPLTQDSIFRLAQTLEIPNPQTASLESCLKKIELSSQRQSLPELDTLERKGPLQDRLIRKVPALEFGIVRNKLRELNELLLQSSTFINEDVVKRYSQLPPSADKLEKNCNGLFKVAN